MGRGQIRPPAEWTDRPVTRWTSRPDRIIGIISYPSMQWPEELEK